MRILILIIFSVIIISCSNNTKLENKVDGLWLVKKVKIDQDEMTPVARWMKFNSDSTQTSGNGWLQHSVGTWSFKNDKLSIINTNGLEDNAQPFSVELKSKKMMWSRVEEGQNVQVFLERIDKIPASDGNKLMGLWNLKSISSNNGNENLILQHRKTLYLSWDNRFILQREGRPRIYGIYKIHGHKPELQMVNYGDNPKFTFYKFSLLDNKLTLKNTEGNEVLFYSRIHQFPQ